MTQGMEPYPFIILLGFAWQMCASEVIPTSKYNITEEHGTKCQNASRYKITIQDVIMSDDELLVFPETSDPKDFWYYVRDSSIPVLKREMFTVSRYLFIVEIMMTNSNISRMEDYVFKKLAFLECLDLSKNHLRGITKEAFSGLIKLHHLDLSSNALNSLEPETFGSLTNLKHLDLSNNPITRISNFAFNGLSTLSYLDASSLNVTSLEPETFVGLRNLHSLDISKNHIREISQNTFKGLSELVSLNFSSNLLDSLGQESFTDLMHLVELDLSNNPINIMHTNISFEPLIALEKLYLRKISNHSNLLNLYLMNFPRWFQNLQKVFVSDIDFMKCSYLPSMVLYASLPNVCFITRYSNISLRYFSEFCYNQDSNNQLRKETEALNTLIDRTADEVNLERQEIEALYTIINRTAVGANLEEIVKAQLNLGYILMTFIVIITLILSGLLFKSFKNKYRKAKERKAIENICEDVTFM